MPLLMRVEVNLETFDAAEAEGAAASSELHGCRLNYKLLLPMKLLC